MTGLKGWLEDFPGQNATVASALLLFLLTGLVVIALLALERPFPAGYEAWFVTLATFAGIATGGMGIKRLTDFRYKAAGTSPVTVEAPSTVTVTNTGAAPAADGVAAPSAPAQPVAFAEDRHPVTQQTPARLPSSLGNAPTEASD